MENVNEVLADANAKIAKSFETLKGQFAGLRTGKASPALVDGVKVDYYGAPTHHCVCTPGQIQRYMNRISGPLLDRIDIQVEVPSLDYSGVSAAAPSEPSAAMREAVSLAQTEVGITSR